MHHEGTKDTKVSENYFSELRALRVLRGENYSFFFGCDYAALVSSWSDWISLSSTADGDVRSLMPSIAEILPE